MRMDGEAICICRCLKERHSYHIDYCHDCTCRKFKWDNLDYLEAKSELEDKNNELSIALEEE